ncbi:MAG: ATP-binding protein [Candidatus Ozemobacteraceae bacterium]
MERFFNTAGPINPEDHYCIDPLRRFDLGELLSLIDQKKYFILHAPRQTGKTSCLKALADHLNGEGQYRALYCNFEAGQAARENLQMGMKTIAFEIAQRAEETLSDRFLVEQLPSLWQQTDATGILNVMLSAWSHHDPRPLVLMIDEIDSLIGDLLISVLRQLRSGYDKRPTDFPQSVILCGVRDIKDYRIHSGSTKEIITGGSAFNIKAKSLRIGDFSREEVSLLLREHTIATGQIFSDEALDLAWTYTCGQPWLINALAYEATFEMVENRDRTRPITGRILEEAKERLILGRQTHLDQLTDKLREDRVRKVIQPMLVGGNIDQNVTEDDRQYVLDLGLIRKTPTGLDIANPIYREVIPRELSRPFDDIIAPRYTPIWYVAPDGRLDVAKLMQAFQDFFREHASSWIQRYDYAEAGVQLLLQSFLQRVINGGGRLDREYGLARGRADLFIRWPIRPEFEGRRYFADLDYPCQKVVFELKILYKSLEATIAEGRRQIGAYADTCGTDEAHLVIFDRESDKPWEEKIFHCIEDGLNIWGL